MAVTLLHLATTRDIRCNFRDAGRVGRLLINEFIIGLDVHHHRFAIDGPSGAGIR